MGTRGIRTAVALAAVTACVGTAVPARAQVPPPGPPVFSSETPAGTGTTVAEKPVSQRPAFRVDGDPSDWVGRPSGWAGTAVYSAGEYVYQDHLFDAWGADDGRDAQRMGTLDPLAATAPDTYRLDALMQADVPGEFGAPTPDAISASEHYGDAPSLQDTADLVELRVAADRSTVHLLARTTTMTAPDQTALLVLADTRPGSVSRSVPFGSGLKTSTADVALLLAGSGGWVADLASGAVTPLPAGSVATNPSGYVNALEAAVPRALVAGPAGNLHLAAATGTSDNKGGLKPIGSLPVRVANVAFRFHEPVRVWFDKQQALALQRGSIDGFFTTIATDKLDSGASERYRPGPGYHERIFTSAEAISNEGGVDGTTQHYGVYIPGRYREGERAPLTFWLHWRGGSAHSAAAWAPRIMREFGEERGALVVSPRGRGTASWYVGRGMADFQEVSADVAKTFSVDEDRVSVTGHSMGGWGSYLMSVLFPDRFAGAVPVSPPVTQGAFTGVDFAGCDSFRYDEYTPCYVQANGGDARTEHTLPLLDNLRNTPLAIYAGGVDELVPVGGEIRQAERLAELGYRYRLYLFPTYEHYTPPIVDEWSEFARWLDGLRRPRTPAHVTYVRSMPFERAIDDGPNLAKPVHLGFTFDRAWWMSELTPADPAKGVAKFDGRTLGVVDSPTRAVPEAGGPTAVGQTGPFAMTGLNVIPDPLAAKPARSNRFEVTLSGARAVTLDLRRMALDVRRVAAGTVTADHDLDLGLLGPWHSPPTVFVNGAPAPVTASRGRVVVHIPAGTTHVEVRPRR